jgi:hypothetical protein
MKELNLSTTQLEMLKKLLHAYESFEDHSNPLVYGDVVEYEYSILESEKIIDLYNFRLSGAVHKSTSIIELIEHIRLNNAPMIIIHSLYLTNNRKFMIYTNSECEKIVYILPLGAGYRYGNEAEKQ